MKQQKSFTAYRRQKQNQRRIFLVSLGIVLVCVAATVLLYYKGYFTGIAKTQVNTASGPAMSETSSLGTGASSQASAPLSSVPAVSPAAESQTVSTPEPPPASAANPAVQTAAPVPSPAPGDFTNSLFIGDSRTRGLRQYTGLTEAVFYTATGLMVNTAMTKPVVKDGNGNSITIPQALQTAQFNKVYIMLGVNELGWAYSNIFIDDYKALIQAVQAAEPNANVYVQSIIPVTAEKSAGDPIYNNGKIAEYNALLQQMAAELGVGFLNVQESVVGADGALPADAATDGVHLNQAYCQRWLDYLRANS